MYKDVVTFAFEEKRSSLMLVGWFGQQFEIPLRLGWPVSCQCHRIVLLRSRAICLRVLSY